MGPAILGGIVLLFILLAYLGAKAWHIWHVVLVVFVFLAAAGALILTAATMRTQKVWREKYKSHMVSLEREQATNQRLIYGAPASDPNPMASMQSLRGQVGRVMVDRGRVWRNLRLAGVGQGTLTLDATGLG